MKLLTFFLVVASSFHLSAYEVAIRHPEGNLELIDVAPEQRFEDFIDSLNGSFQSESLCVVDFIPRSIMDFSRKTGSVRDYQTPLSSSEKSDLRYIINTLGMSSLAKIAKERSSLKKAGSRIDNVHPFRFLAGIFTDEEMKTSLHAMKNRGWVWGGFFDGIESSLTEESKKNNLIDYVADFARILNIDPAWISSSVAQGNWKELVNTLLDRIPRSKNNDRYKM